MDGDYNGFHKRWVDKWAGNATIDGMAHAAPLLPGRLYHLYVSAAHPEVLFADDQAYEAFLRGYAAWMEPVATLYAYCLLPNHWHLFVRLRPPAEQLAQQITADTPADADPLPRLLDPEAQLTRLTAVHATSRPPTVIRVPVRDRLNYPHLVRYIHQNPTLHGHCANFRLWRWSSYRAILGDRPTRVEAATVLRWFFDREWFEDVHWERQDETKIGYLILED